MIIRIEKTNNYSVIHNEVARRTDLSARAKGIFYYLMTLPDDWKLFKGELYTHFKEGRKALDTAFNELKEAGYIKMTRVKNSQGHFKEWEYQLREASEIPFSDVSETGKSENRPIGNRQLLNTDKPNTKKLNTKKEYISLTPKIKVTPEEHKKLLDLFGESKLNRHVENMQDYLSNPNSRRKTYKCYYRGLLDWDKNDWNNKENSEDENVKMVREIMANIEQEEQNEQS